MPQLVYDTDHYLYTTKRDIYILHLIDQISHSMIYDRTNAHNIEIAKSQLDWLDAHSVNYALTNPPSIMEGWVGWYYIEFASPDDPALLAYSKEFEDEDGVKSKFPHQFQMYRLSYDAWVKDGKLAEYEKYLIDRESPDWID